MAAKKMESEESFDNRVFKKQVVMVDDEFEDEEQEEAEEEVVAKVEPHKWIWTEADLSSYDVWFAEKVLDPVMLRAVLEVMWDEESGFRYNANVLEEDFEDGRMFMLTVGKLGGTAIPLPVVCTIEKDHGRGFFIPQIMWVSEKIQRRGFGKKLVQKLGFKQVYHVVNDSKGFWEACGVSVAEDRYQLEDKTALFVGDLPLPLVLRALAENASGADHVTQAKFEVIEREARAFKNMDYPAGCWMKMCINQRGFITKTTRYNSKTGLTRTAEQVVASLRAASALQL